MVALLALVPSIPAQATAGVGSLVGLWRRRPIRVGVLALLLGIGGHTAAYTFIAPFLGERGQITGEALSAVLLAYGAANFLGNILGGWAAGRALRPTLVTTSALLGSSLILLQLTATTTPAAIASAMLWGLAYGALPVVMLNWMFAAAPDHLEGASALQVTAAQLAIGGGALVGGLVADHVGVAGALWVGAAGTLLVAPLTLVTRPGFSSHGVHPTGPSPAS